MTHPLVKFSRRIKENRYKGPISVDITCSITRAYGISCPVCWHDITPDNDCETCQSMSMDFSHKAKEVSDVFLVPVGDLSPVYHSVFVP